MRCSTTRGCKKIIEVISKAPFIQITGLGGSALVGRDLSFKLMKIGYRVACEADTHVQATVSQALKKRRCTNRYLLQRQ